VRTGSGALLEQLAFRALRVSDAARSKSSRASSNRPSLNRRVAAHTGKQVVALEGRFRGQGIDDFEARRRTESHGDGHPAIQLHYRGGFDPRQRPVSATIAAQSVSSGARARA
jgi:hypothetical protein